MSNFNCLPGDFEDDYNKCVYYNRSLLGSLIIDNEHDNASTRFYTRAPRLQHSEISTVLISSTTRVKHIVEINSRMPTFNNFRKTSIYLRLASMQTCIQLRNSAFV